MIKISEIKISELPKDLQTQLKQESRNGYTIQTRGVINNDKIKCRKPQRLGLHIVLAILSIGILNVVYIIWNHLQAKRYYTQNWTNKEETGR